MARRVVVGDVRVQRLDRRNGLRSWTIVWPEGTVHEEADRFLRVHDGSGTQKTYAYYLVDHLRWLEPPPAPGVDVAAAKRGIKRPDQDLPRFDGRQLSCNEFERFALSVKNDRFARGKAG